MTGWLTPPVIYYLFVFVFISVAGFGISGLPHVPGSSCSQSSLISVFFSLVLAESAMSSAVCTYYIR